MRRGRGGPLAAGTLLATIALAAPAAASPAPEGAAALQPNTPSTGSHVLLDFKDQAGGFRPKALPTALGLAFAKGFVLDTSAVPGVCTAAQANKLQCPEDSRLGAGAIGVVAYGPAFSPGGDHFLAKLGFFRAAPPVSGDTGGIVFSFKETTSGFSGASIGSIRSIDQGDYGTLIRWDKLPLPALPPGFQFTIDHLQVDLGVGSAAAPVKKPSHRRRHRRKRHVVALPCVRYRGPRHHRHCVAYRHRRRHARAAAATSFVLNPPTCAGTWAIQLQVGYKDGEEQREAAAPCVAG